MLDSSGRVITSSQGPVPNNTQHSQQTDVHAAGGIRTHNLSSRAAAYYVLDRAANGTGFYLYLNPQMVLQCNVYVYLYIYLFIYSFIHSFIQMRLC